MKNAPAVTTLLALHRTPDVKKILLHLLTAFFVVATALPGVTRAENGDSGYVALQVPDLRQAVVFFNDVMNCRVISQDTGFPGRRALLDCGNQTTLELNRSDAAAHPSDIPPNLRLDTDDAASVVAWLRAQRLQLAGPPRPVVNGPDAGRVAVTFLTPWGQPLQLISRVRSNDLLQTTTPAARLAAQ